MMTGTPSPAPVVLVTGASRGIGAATALAFGESGWRVAMAARSQHEGQALAHQLRRPDGRLLTGSLSSTLQALQRAGAQALACTMDLLDVASLNATVDRVLDHFGRVDLLINNAVYQDPEMNARVAQLSADALQRTFSGNVVAPLHLVQRLLPVFALQGGGQVINVASGAGAADSPLPPDAGGWSFAYGASKAAMARLSGFINLEHGAQGVRAFTVNPGLVSTEAVTATLGDGGLLEQRYGAMSPQRIAQALLWLATAPEARNLSRGPGMVDLQPLIRSRNL
jgi:NAD(P)-dependent dehydrogenase (short-subunit alcohol dehydrogenase family)